MKIQSCLLHQLVGDDHLEAKKQFANQGYYYRPHGDISFFLLL